MLFKNILNNTLYFALLSSFALTKAKRDDCEEVKDYVSENVENYAEVSHYLDEKVIDYCEVNENGEMTILEIRNFMLNEEEVDRVLSYDTVKELVYLSTTTEFTQDNNEYPPRIGKLTNLETLHLKVADIPKNFVKGSSSTLKSLFIGLANIQQQNIDDISNLPNLEILILDECALNNKLRLKSLNKLKNLKFLSISGTFEKRIDITQNMIKDIATLTNLEELMLENCNFKESIDYSPLKKLTNVKNIRLDGNLSKKAKIQLPSNLKSAHIQSFSISQNLIDALTATPSLEELVFNSVKYLDGINFDMFKNLVNLTNFETSADNQLNYLPKGFCSLENLKYLQFRGQNIREIPDEIVNLQNLEYLNIGGNNISTGLDNIGKLKNLKLLYLDYNNIKESLEPLSNLKNLEYFDFCNNGNGESLEPLGNLLKLETL